MAFQRRAFLATVPALMAMPVLGATQSKAPGGSFPAGFMWGSATAGHQVEGNNTASDIWLLENVKPTVFKQPSGDACNSFELWECDLDLVKSLGLNTYRFSLEWARIEPEPGLISAAMLDHYKAMIEGCRRRGITSVVTYNHYTGPRWFAAQGGWTQSQAPSMFARFCELVTRHLGEGIGYATTLNEPNILMVLRVLLPKELFVAQRAMLDAAARAIGSTKFVAANAANPEDYEVMTTNLIAGHKLARAAIKAVRPELPVGVSLAMFDDQAVGSHSRRDAARHELYGEWLETARGDDFIGVQNYERVRYDANGRLPPPPGAKVNFMGAEIYAPSLGGAVRYAHQVTGIPVMVTEHGLGLDGDHEDDSMRATFIPASLAELKAAIDDGVPVKGYIHWSLLDNFEWISGYRPRFGLVAVDRKTFARKPKPSAAVYSGIARRNAL
jgi:beta-glucosidase